MDLFPGESFGQKHLPRLTFVKSLFTFAFLIEHKGLARNSYLLIILGYSFTLSDNDSDNDKFIEDFQHSTYMFS